MRGQFIRMSFGFKTTVEKEKRFAFDCDQCYTECREVLSCFFMPIFTIPGRTFPVEVMDTKEPESDYLSIADQVMQIHLTEPPETFYCF